MLIYPPWKNLWIQPDSRMKFSQRHGHGYFLVQNIRETCVLRTITTGMNEDFTTDLYFDLTNVRTQHQTLQWFVTRIWAKSTRMYKKFTCLHFFVDLWWDLFERFQVAKKYIPTFQSFVANPKTVPLWQIFTSENRTCKIMSSTCFS